MSYTKAGRRAMPYPQKRASAEAGGGGHGGKREGAGRKPVNGEAMVTRAFVITQEQDALLTLRARNRGISKSEYLRQVIDAEHKRKRV